MKKILSFCIAVILIVSTGTVYANSSNEMLKSEASDAIQHLKENGTVVEVITDAKRIQEEINSFSDLKDKNITKITTYQLLSKKNEKDKLEIGTRNYPWPVVFLSTKELLGESFYFPSEVMSNDSMNGPGFWEKTYEYTESGKASLSTQITGSLLQASLGYDYTETEKVSTTFHYDMLNSNVYTFKTWVYYKKHYIEGTYYQPNRDPIDFTGNTWYPIGIRVRVYE